MSKLPTQEDLERLYHEKGRDALVWYAWRNALRTLPALGCLPLQEIWRSSALIRNVYSICRVPIVLAQWGDGDITHYIEPIAEAAKIAKVSVSTRTAAVTQMAKTASAARLVKISMTRASRVARVVLTALDMTKTVNNSISELTYLVTQSMDARLDYDLVSQEMDCSIKDSWHTHPLWHIGEPNQIRQWKHSLINDLQSLGLEFLADDLNDLWEGRSLGAHAINYLKKISDADLNDPDALRRLILEGEAAEHIHAVRALLLGPGGAGKSSLADRLQGKPVEHGKKLTVGVDYLNHQPLNLYDKFKYLQQGDKPLDLYLWDFGGQTIFHGLHSAFLHENCVYVLVVDSRHEQAPDEWLHQIRHLAGGQAKVLLVTNWYEQCETRQNQARLLREFPDLLDESSFFYFSCHEPDAPGLQAFVQALEKACLESQRMVLKETLEVNAALQQQYQNDVFLDSADLEDIIEQVTRRPESVAILSNKLEQLGFLVRVDSDDQQYCLKPAWAVDHAYALLYSPLLRETNGLLRLKTLQQAFKGTIEATHVRYLVEFLQERSLCRKLTGGEGYFFPDAARADELPAASALLIDTTRLNIRFDLPYLPLGFHARLVHRLLVPDGMIHPDDIWRQGFILRKRNSQAVVHYSPRKSAIEMVLVGAWHNFAELLNTLLINLKVVLAEGRGISGWHIHPSVVLDRHVFSVHSAERLVAVLGQISSYEQLIQEVKTMAGKINVKVGDNTQVAIDASATAPDISAQLLAEATRIQALPLDADSKRRLLAMYAMLEKKRGTPAPPAESIIQGLQEMGEEAQRNGLTPEILDDILNG